MDFKGLTLKQLEEIIIEAKCLAHDLKEGGEPSYFLAKANGIVDKSYQTLAFGLVSSYSGEAVITMANGQKWCAIGHGSTGSATTLTSRGWIEFKKIEDAPQNRGTVQNSQTTNALQNAGK
jgi:hypothetical protein